MPNQLQAGMPVDDMCRVCKEVRRHTVLAVDPRQGVVRVQCGYCSSQHNFRGGAKDEPRSAAEPPVPYGAFPIVSNRERSFPPMAAQELDKIDLELMLRRIIREEAGITPAVPADKWRGGELVLRPGKQGLQEKTIPIETFFHKIVMLRNRLRVLEQQINSAELSEELKVKLQGYVTGCYGTLTTFNILFAEDDDRFRGSGDPSA